MESFPSMLSRFMRALGELPAIGMACARTFVLERRLATLGVAGTLRWIDRSCPPPQTLATTEAFERGERIARRAYRGSPYPNTCLRRSLLQYWIHRREASSVRFVIGVRTSEGIEAHAWVECIDGSVRGPANDAFAEIYVASASGSPPS